MNEDAAGTKRFTHWMIIAVVIVALDQATKWAIVEWVPLYGRVPINDFMNLTHQRNFGAAFSFLADAGGWQRWFFITLATAVSVLLVVWSWKERRVGSTLLIAGLALVLGGAVGNLVDRVLLGYVTDFIQVWFGSWAFPSFNIADSAITVGAGLLILDSFLAKPEEKQPASDEAG
ncbi:MAG: signal peptidase II [Pseudomonadota bacterium]